MSVFAILVIMKILVLGGGTSPERDVSLRSAAAVRDAATDLGHAVTYLDPAAAELPQLIETAYNNDVTLPILHGIGGEDGFLQDAFEAAGVHYLGSGANACRSTFNKARFKELLLGHSLPTPKHEIVSSESFNGSPLSQSSFVLKPIEGGSSIDTFIIRSTGYDSDPLHTALKKYGTMLIEELIEGSEVTVGVLGAEALPVIEIIPPENGEFDYENKYNGATAELCPPKNISASLQRHAQELAVAIHQLAGCRHMSRTDIMISRQGKLFIIDTNTIPGMTNQSLFPKAARAEGYAWNELVAKLIELSTSKK